MNNYIEVRIDLDPCDEISTDLLAAFLAEAGYETFVPDETGLTAYVREEDFSTEGLDQAVMLSGVSERAAMKVTHTLIEGKDWNEEWEKNYFQPIVVGSRCVIHSSFHHDIPRCDYDIVIDPKMAFGTGHHATTSLILEQLLQLDLDRKSVLDMGTGTGILAILASMRGANPVKAIEIDEFAFTNALENFKINHADNVNAQLGDARLLEGISGIEVFIANINRNIITGDIAAYTATLAPGATMLLSGFYEADIPVIMEAAAPLGLVEEGHTVRDNWTCLRLVKS
ncbi:MAG: 50S ribosomal protein L11 methyltransferase [Duncaniella sp.]|nr:50S ribosomal protein L11 methyltransferase [Duncaniella sp.]